jgi:hypothetical protein
MDRVFTVIERAALPKQVVYSDFAGGRQPFTNHARYLAGAYSPL